MTSRTVSGSVNTTSLIRGGVMPCAESNTICARRHVTTEPDARRTIRSNRLPSSLVISRNCPLTAKSAPSRRAVSTRGFDSDRREPCYVNPANVAGYSTRSAQHAEEAQVAERPALVEVDPGAGDEVLHRRG